MRVFVAGATGVLGRRAVAALVGARPAAVCNLATTIPSAVRSADPRAWQENNRIRAEGSRNLVDAALAAGATTYVQESIAFLYGDHGDEWVDAETTPLVDTRFSAAV